jgi:hypothetical protein
MRKSFGKRIPSKVVNLVIQFGLIVCSNISKFFSSEIHRSTNSSLSSFVDTKAFGKKHYCFA